TDNTAGIVAAFGSPRVRLLRQPRNEGKTAAIKVGVQHVTSAVTIIQDADLEYDTREIPFVIDPILAGKADLAYGARCITVFIHSILSSKADIVYCSRFLVRKATSVAYFYHYVGNKVLTFI